MTTIRLTKEQATWLKKKLENIALDLVSIKDKDNDIKDQIEHANTIVYKLTVEEEHR